MKDFFEALDRARQSDWGTKSSLLLYSAVAFFAGTGLVLALQYVGLQLNLVVRLLLMAAPVAIVIILWLARWYSLYDPNLIAVGFAIHPSSERSRMHYQQLLRRLNQSIDERGLGGHVQVKVSPADKIFRNSAEAEDYIVKKGLRLLIWGEAEDGSVSGTDVTRFNLRASYQIARLPEVVQTELKQIIADSNKHKAWDIQLTDTFSGLDLVAGNVFESSLLTLGLCLSTVRQETFVVHAVRVLEAVDELLSNKAQGVSFPNRDSMLTQVRDTLRGNYSALMTYYYNDKRSFGEAYDVALRLLALDPHDFSANLLMGALSWLRSEAAEAEKYTRIAESIRPKQPLTQLNLAFLDLNAGRYKIALNRYKNLRNKPLKDLTNMVDVVDFVMNEYDKTQLPAMLFAAAWLNSRDVDKELAAGQLTEFVRLADGEPSLEILVREAKKLLSS